MKATIKTLLILALCASIFSSCKEEDEGDELHIQFITDSGNVYSDTTLPGGSNVTIGIEAETEKPQDPIISFNVSESVNGAADSTIHQETGLDDTAISYQNIYTIGTVSGNTNKYTFTITNRDGINKQVSLTVTVQ